MKKAFNVKKLPLDTLINLLIELFESGVDFVDLSADNTDPLQDKLIIETRPSYFSEDEDEKPVPKIESRRLTEEDLNDLI